MKKIYFIYLLAIMLFSCEKPISEFQSENFIKFFGSGFESKGNDVIELSDGGYLFTGYDKVDGIDYQIFIGKVDKNGNLVWSKTYGNSDNREEGKLIKEVSDGFLIAGISKGSSGITHSFIMKTGVDGDSSWYKEFGDASYSITVNDIVVTSSNIFIAGHSNKTDANRTDFYRAKLDLSGELIWGVPNFMASNSSFKGIFIQSDNLLLIGDYGFDKVISIVSVLQSNGNAISSENTTSANESVGDACLAGDQLCLLINGPSGFKLSKLDSGHSEVWKTEAVGSIVGKSVASNDDGTFMVCGEGVDAKGSSTINFIKVNADGSIYNGVQFFKTFQGTVGGILKTKDNGLILVGATNSDYGMNVQLIKTDKDYFMLRN